MNERLSALGRRYARLATRLAVAHPRLWGVLRRPMRAQFDALAPSWDARRSTEWVGPLSAALERVEFTPARILDLGTGTGIAARWLAERYPGAEVTGADLSPGMIDQARTLSPPELRFDIADASALPYADGAFDLVTLLNMIPFFDELARVTTSGGAVAIGFSSGAGTPIYVPPETLRAKLEGAGFERVEAFGPGGAFATVAIRGSDLSRGPAS